MSMIREVNLDTNEVIDREMTKEELLVVQKDKKHFEKREAELAKAEIEKATLLAKLGITADEAKLLLS